MLVCDAIYVFSSLTSANSATINKSPYRDIAKLAMGVSST